MLLWKRKIGKVYSLEHTNIQKVFSTPHRVGNCCNEWSEVIFPLCHPRSCRLSTPVGKVTPRPSRLLTTGKNATNRYGRLHKVFFAHARAWRTRNKIQYVMIRSQTSDRLQRDWFEWLLTDGITDDDVISLPMHVISNSSFDHWQMTTQKVRVITDGIKGDDVISSRRGS
jgi:hypothetical protein